MSAKRAMIEWRSGENDLKNFNSNEFILISRASSITEGTERSISEIIEEFLNCKSIETVTGLEVNDQIEGYLDEAIEVLIENRERLPRLRYLRIGSEDGIPQISHIQHGDIKPLLDAFPGLEHLYIIGSAGLTFEACRHICLKSLTIECSCLSTDVIQGIANSIFPELECLELWLGDEFHGWTGSEKDIHPFLYEKPFQKLTHLGLCNCTH